MRGRRCTLRLTALAAAVALAATACYRDGTWIVYQQIQPGLYRSMGADPGRLCGYMRLGPQGQVHGDGFANDTDGPQYVEVAPTDHSFTTRSCQMWVAAPADQSALPGGPPIPDGMWRVGVDVSPGVYGARGSAICTWKRLSNARHDATSVIEEGTIGIGGFEVLTIQANDAFFETRGCEHWDRVQI
jgi:hypothetical protein